MNRRSITTLALVFLTQTALVEAALFDALEYRNVGPTRGGRATAVAGTVVEPGTFYFGGSGSGVWKTTDYGETWSNVSDGFFASPSIGAIAVSQTDPNVLYAGTGSDGLRSNVIPGKGVYRSRDAGRSWDFVGLEKSGHVGAVEIDPRSNNTVWVAAIGSAFAPNPERGVYRSRNGGESWDKVLEISDSVGFADLELLPHNPDTILAAAWKAERKPWTIISGGTQEEGGLFKSTDGGDSWRRITTGLPTGLIGKIDLAVSPADSSVVYALVEAPGDAGGVYRSDDQGESFRLVSNKDGLRTRPFYYGNIDADPTDADTVYVNATRFYRSTDGGEAWEQVDTPHGDNHGMWINPEDSQLYVQVNDGGANVTHNGGKTWSTQFNQPTVEVYTLNVDDQYPYWLYAGQQDNYSTIAVPSQAPRGVQNHLELLMSTGGCETGPAVPKPGDADTVYVNCKGRFGVYDKRTGTERSYYIGAANMYGQNPADLRYRFQRVSPVHVSPHDPDTVYMGSQYLHRTRDGGVTWETLSPDLTANEADKQVVSGSPITRDITGEEFYSTLYAIGESPVEAGVIWTGSNDGPVHVTRNGGETWNDVTPKGLPAGGRVDSVEPSPHDAGVAYVAVLRYQLGDPKPYVYRAEDYGRRWRLLTDGSNGIPADYPVRVVREDPQTPGLLYAGTDSGLFISFDDGGQWHAFQQNLPVTPVTDIRIYRDDIALSTMGRGFWILDKAANTLRQLAAAPDATDLALFEPADTVRLRKVSGAPDADAVPQFPTPGVLVDYRLPEAAADTLTLEVFDSEGTLLNAYRSAADGDEEAELIVKDDMAMSTVEYIEGETLPTAPGLNRFRWNMRARGAWDDDAEERFKGGPLVPPGTYLLRLTVGDQMLETNATIVLDPRVPGTGVTAEDIGEQFALQMQVRDLLDEARRLADELSTERDDLEADNPRGKLIDATLDELKTAEGTYMPPGLISQISYLDSMLGGADQAPGGEATDRYAELRARFDDLASAL